MSETEHIEVQTETIVDGIVLKPLGEIDLSRAPSLRHHIAQVQSGKPKRLVIDLQGVSYMDSSGVATLVEAMQVARRTGQKLVLCQLQDKVQSIFEIARLDMVFTIVKSREEALAT